MRVLLDTNILVSYLLRPAGTIQLVVDAGLAGAYQLLIPEALLDELAVTILAKEQLRSRIPEDTLHAFIAELKRVGIEIHLQTFEIPTITRDPKDDYLIAYAVQGEADILISGDQDLLILGQAGKLSFLSPADFIKFLEEN